MIRVLVIDDHALIRRGLGELFESIEDIGCIATIDDGIHAETAVLEHSPDIVLMDISMPKMDGIEATKRVLATRPETKVIMLTSFSDHAGIINALEAGAIGYLLKDAEPDDIVRAIRDAAAGGAPLSPQAARALLPDVRPRATKADSLTPRELEVLALVAEGLPNKSIARRLAISEKTVKAHLTRVFAALGVADRTSAALWAQRHGLV